MRLRVSGSGLIGQERSCDTERASSEGDRRRKRVEMRDIQTIAGTWRLIGAGASAALPSPHHVKFVFSVEGGRVRGAIVRQDDDGQLPVDVVFDGPRLRLWIISPVPIPGDPAELPWLMLMQVGDAFEGYWERESGGRLKPAIALRLVRATA